MNDNSVITRTRRIKFCQASSDATKPLPVITHIAFGSGGVNLSGEPIAPSETQTALNTEIARYPVDSVTYPEETTARYAVTIPKDDLAGEIINEAMATWPPSRPCIPSRRMKASSSPSSSMMNFNQEGMDYGRRILQPPGSPGI